MNGARTTFMRRGYLLTALAAAVLLAASLGTAEAQRVSIGFGATSGEVSEKAFLHVNSLTDPQMVTIQVGGLLSGSRRTGDVDRSLNAITITPNQAVYIARVDASGVYATGAANDATTGAPTPIGDLTALTANSSTAAFTLDHSHFDHSDEVTLVVAQSQSGSGDTNWVSEMVELKLGITGSASVGPDVFTLTVMDTQAQPVATFLQPDFTLSEASQRDVMLDIASGRPGVPIPGAAATAFTGATNLVSVRVGNHGLVALNECPARGTGLYNRKLFYIEIEATEWTEQNFTNTGVLQTVETIGALADNPATPAANATANMTIHGCGDGAGIRNPYITLTIMETQLVGRTTAHRTNGNFAIGPPLMVTIDSDEASPTLSFSPTDVEIDEGGSTDTVLLAEGPNASDVGMVKLMVEGDAMVDLYQDGEMLEEIGGYVTVDLGGNSSARLMAMSTSDPDLMDGDMADKAWKLTDDSAQGVNIGDGSWFKVVVRGSTAVPALPLVGQLLLALFLMAGGSRLYRRRRG